MSWWIVGALVALPLLLVALAGAVVRSGQAELSRVAALAAERRAADAAALQPRQQRLQVQVTALAARAQRVSARAEQLRSRLARPPGSDRAGCPGAVARASRGARVPGLWGPAGGHVG